LQGHLNTIYSLAFSSDGAYLASSGVDGTIKLWDVGTRACLQSLRSERPYERMDITGATGLTEAQRITLKALGAIEEQTGYF
jgi:WD40 repeat protein